MNRISLNLINTRKVQLVPVIFVIIFIIGCKKNVSDSLDKKVEHKNIVLTTNQNKKDTVISVEVPNIEGRYDLVEGYGKGPGSIHDYTIYKGILFINRISNNEFGFVKVIKRHQLTPNAMHGVLSFYNNQFYRKEINYSKKSIYHALSWSIEKNDDMLYTIEYTSNMTTYTIWKKSNPEVDVYISLRKTLQKEKEEYTKFYKNIYNNSDITGKDGFSIYKTGKKYIVNDSAFLEKWKAYTKK
ncbi:hypothetical protein [Aquimarina aquimarini]|uniref:hypothetical protein n=1 Tax=Aquimarina aquimarini TaxID=1191734 RepID=UPI000D55BBFD|nr:hypothetical protein [Aquimarina aquimarini]